MALDLTKRKMEAFFFLVIVAFIIIYSNPAETQRQGLSPTNVKFTPDLTVYYAPTGNILLMSSFEGKMCFVDDERMVGCYKDGIQYTKEFINGVDWGSYGSCKGWMSYYGCVSTECNYMNGGTCSGSSSDSDEVECITDNQCTGGYCGPENKCITGAPAECKVSQGEYQCTEGLIYHCIDNRWTLLTSCHEIEKTTECKTKLGDDWNKLCKQSLTGCESDSDCKIFGIFGNKVCSSGECVIEEKPEIKWPSIQEWFQQNKTIGIIFIGLLLAGFFIWAFSEKKK